MGTLRNAQTGRKHCLSGYPPSWHRPPVILIKMASAQPQTRTENTSETANIISALTKALKGQNGAPLTGDQLAHWLHQNMTQLSALAKEGKLTQGQIIAVRNWCRSSPLREFNPARTLTRRRGSCVSPLSLCHRDCQLTRCILSLSVSFRVPSSKSSPTNRKPQIPTLQTKQALPQQPPQQRP